MPSNPPFAYGTLLYRPIERVPGSSNIVLTGRVQIPVQTSAIPAYVKLLSPREHAAESVCAWLAKALALKAPEPLWVVVPRNRMPASVAWPFGDEETHCCFGTVAIQHARALNVAELQPGVLQLHLAPHLLALACIAVFDELIGNEDRHERNILVSPRGVPLIIDHVQTLGAGGGGLFSGPILHTPRFLFSLIEQLPTSQRFEMRAPLQTFVAACRDQVNRIPSDHLKLKHQALRRSMAHYLEQRVEQLPDVVSKILGMPDLPGVNDGYAARRPIL